MAQKKVTKASSSSMKYAKVTGYIALLAYVVGIVAQSISGTMDINNSYTGTDWASRDLAHNIAVWSAYVFVGLGLYVSAKLSWRYWPIRALFILNKLSDQQRMMRAKTMEWAYRSLGVWTFITLFFGNVDTPTSRSYTLWMIAGLFFLMPSLVAIHRKDA